MTIMDDTCIRLMYGVRMTPQECWDWLHEKHLNLCNDLWGIHRTQDIPEGDDPDDYDIYTSDHLLSDAAYDLDHKDITISHVSQAYNDKDRDTIVIGFTCSYEDEGPRDGVDGDYPMDIVYTEWAKSRADTFFADRDDVKLYIGASTYG